MQENWPKSSESVSPSIEEKQDLKLPIEEYAQQISELVANNQTSIIIGETGSGKSTKMPLILLDLLDPGQKIAITQPRRIAASSVATYVSEQSGGKLGDEIGYQIRFEDRTSEGTRVNFMTDGILLRKLQKDPLLLEYSIVMVDEAHERNLNIDFTLGLLKRAQELRLEQGLEELKIVVTSATLEKEKFAEYFDQAPSVDVPGRLFPVEYHYLDHTPFDQTNAAAEQVARIHSSEELGDILIFMPGEAEINRTIDTIQQLSLVDIELLALHGNIPAVDQNKIFRPSNKRKVIVSTNIAETSVTVPGIRHVIDSGLIRQKQYDAESGIDSLVTIAHAESGCKQRAGRAGRVSSGHYYALYSENSLAERQTFQTPEIQRSNLSNVVLQMKKMGISDVEDFDFIDKPDPNNLVKALGTLSSLGALDTEGNLTEVGEIMAEMPLNPETSRMVIEAMKHNCVNEIATLAAFMGNRSVFVRPKGRERDADYAHSQFQDESSDFLTMLRVWNEYERHNFNQQWANQQYLHSKGLSEVRNLRFQLLKILQKQNILVNQEAATADDISKSIFAGLVENFLVYQGRHAYSLVRDATKEAYIHPSSAVFNAAPKMMVALELFESSKLFARTCQQVNLNWILDAAPQLTSTDRYPEKIIFNESKDTYEKILTVTLKAPGLDLVLGEQQDSLTDDELGQLFARNLAASWIPNNRAEIEETLAPELQDIRARGAVNGALSNFRRIESSDIISIFAKRLHGIKTNTEFRERIQAGEIDLTIHVSDFINEAELAQLEFDSPKKIVINGFECPLRYKIDVGSNRQFEHKAICTIPAEIGVHLTEAPTIPSGIPVYMVYEEGNWDGTNSLEMFTDFCYRHLITAGWDKVKDQNPLFQPARIENFSILDSLPELPGPIEFMKDPINGEPVYAYPTLDVDYSGRSAVIVYVQSKRDSEITISRSKDTIDQLVAQREREKRMAPVDKLLEETIKIAKNFAYYTDGEIQNNSNEVELIDHLTELLDIDEADIDDEYLIELQAVHDGLEGILLTKPKRSVDKITDSYPQDSTTNPYGDYFNTSLRSQLENLSKVPEVIPADEPPLLQKEIKEVRKLEPVVKEEMTPEVKRKLELDLSLTSALIQTLKMFGNPSKAPASKKEQQISAMWERYRELAAKVYNIQNELSREDASPASVRGYISSVNDSFGSLFKRAAPQITADYNSTWLRVVTEAWDDFHQLLENDADAKEYISVLADDGVDTEQIAEKMRNTFIELLPQVIRGKQQIDGKKLLAQVLSAY